MRRLALGLALAACGARTDLGGGHMEDAGTPGVCTKPPPAPASCTTWHAGTPQTIATNAIVADATASGCGVLVASFTMGSSIAWSTHWVDYDGSMLAAPIAHPSLAAQSTGGAAMSLASDGDTTGMLEDDATGCHFVEVDASGHETGAVTSLGAPGCRALARAGSTWSFLRSADTGGSLVTFEQGQMLDTPLAFDHVQYVWDRVVFADGSFLVSGFWEDAVTVKYTSWLTPFDAQGGALGSSVIVPGVETAPVLVARAGAAAIAAWNWTTVEAMPMTTKGAPITSPEVVTTDAPIYELSLFTQPNGDVLFTWIVLDETTNDMSLHARVIAPDGTARGPAALLMNGVDSAQVRGAIESTGARAVLAVTTRDGAIESLPLTCQ